MKRAALTALFLILTLALAAAPAGAETFDLPEGTTVIEDEAFRNCVTLTGDLYIPDGVEEIGAYAFAGCTGLNGRLRLPQTLRTIGAHAFDGCAGLSGAVCISPNTVFDKTAFEGCPNLYITDLPTVAVVGDTDEPEPGTLSGDVWNAVSALCARRDLQCGYYGSLDQAVLDGSDMVIGVGFVCMEFAGTAPDYPETKFVSMDWGMDDQYCENVYAVTYREDQAGFMAGYAAVKLGYRKLGFLGGMEIPAVVSYGDGFKRGVSRAAEELQVTDQVSVVSAYTGRFDPNPGARSRAANWYSHGVEVIFSCGGSQFDSVAAAAAQTGGKVIGVDADQAPLLPGAVVTSAMKAMGRTAVDAIERWLDGGWDQIGGTSVTLGVISATPSLNHVQLPASTQFGAGFTQADYETLVARIYAGQYDAGDVTVADDEFDFVIASTEELDQYADELGGRILVSSPTGQPVDLTWELTVDGSLHIEPVDHFCSLRVMEGGSLTLTEGATLSGALRFDQDGMYLGQLWLDGGDFDGSCGEIAQGTTIYVRSGDYLLPDGGDEVVWLNGGAMDENALVRFAADECFDEIMIQGAIELHEDVTLSCEVRVTDGGSLTVAPGVTLTVASTCALVIEDGTVTIQSGGRLVAEQGAVIEGYVTDLNNMGTATPSPAGTPEPTDTPAPLPGA